MVAGLAAGITALLAASPANAVIERQADGRAIGVAGVPRPTGPNRQHFGRGSAGSDRGRTVSLQYHGGPVLHGSSPYLVFWDPAHSLSPSFRALLARYFVDVAHDSGSASSVYSINRQYTDATGFADYAQTFDPAAQTLQDAQPIPADGCSVTTPTAATCITDDQVQSELDRLVTSEHLPTGAGPSAPIYFVVLPASVNECSWPGNCASSDFCGYHAYFADSSGQTVLYAVLPTMSLAPGPDEKACQWDGNAAAQRPNADAADVALSSVSHEDSETITDPLLDGWYVTANGSEDGDMCASTGGFDPLGGNNPEAFLPLLGGSPTAGTAFNQRIAGDRYYLQSEWSNGAGTCAMRPGPATVAPRFAANLTTGASGTTVTLDPALTASSAGYTSVTWSFGDGGPGIFAPVSGAPGPVSHTYRAPGAYVVTLTVVDRLGNLAVGRENLNVGATGAVAVTQAAPRSRAKPAVNAPTARTSSVTVVRRSRRHKSIGRRGEPHRRPRRS